MFAKTKLRQDYLQKRQSLSWENWQEKSDRLCQQLKTCPLYQKANTILAYFSFRQEPDLSSLFTSEKIWGFPRCVEKSLVWHQWKQQEALNQGKYGILEPFDHAPLIKAESVDLILVPAVACDRQGFRLGYGGGFYDRFLSNSRWNSIPTLGIIFDFAYVSKLPTEPWDKALKGICTDQQWELLQKF